ncbi:hypothetical protein EMCRGX_G032664 [Ephydatia muelleri]
MVLPQKNLGGKVLMVLRTFLPQKNLGGKVLMVLRTFLPQKNLGGKVLMVLRTFLPQKNLGGKVLMVLRMFLPQKRLGGLPNEENSKLQNIHYICSSNKVSAIEMAAPMVEELLHLQNEGMVVYDAYFKCDVIVVPSVLCILSDNPRASEICNHLGSSASLFCRVCMTNSATGLDNIAEYRTKAQTLQHIQSIQQCLTETEKKHIRNLYGITEDDNTLLELDLDLHRHGIDYNTSVLQCNAVDSDDGQLINVGRNNCPFTTIRMTGFAYVPMQGSILFTRAAKMSIKRYPLTEISLVPIYHDPGLPRLDSHWLKRQKQASSTLANNGNHRIIKQLVPLLYITCRTRGLRIMATSSGRGKHSKKEDPPDVKLSKFLSYICRHGGAFRYATEDF